VELYGGELVDPRPFAVGEIAETFTKYPHLGAVLPAVGYGEQQLSDLHATLVRARAAGVKALAIGTPVDLARVIALPLPHTRVRYGFKLRGDQSLAEMVLRAVGRV
jgi:predicted GTPase